MPRHPQTFPKVVSLLAESSDRFTDSVSSVVLASCSPNVVSHFDINAKETKEFKIATSVDSPESSLSADQCA